MTRLDMVKKAIYAHDICQWKWFDRPPFISKHDNRIANKGLSIGISNRGVVTIQRLYRNGKRKYFASISPPQEALDYFKSIVAELEKVTK